MREWAVDELRECFDFDIMIGEGARGDVSRESSDDTEVAEDDTEEAEHEENWEETEESLDCDIERAEPERGRPTGEFGAVGIPIALLGVRVRSGMSWKVDTVSSMR